MPVGILIFYFLSLAFSFIESDRILEKTTILDGFRVVITPITSFSDVKSTPSMWHCFLPRLHRFFSPIRRHTRRHVCLHGRVAGHELPPSVLRPLHATHGTYFFFCFVFGHIYQPPVTFPVSRIQTEGINSFVVLCFLISCDVSWISRTWILRVSSLLGFLPFNEFINKLLFTFCEDQQQSIITSFVQQNPANS